MQNAQLREAGQVSGGRKSISSVLVLEDDGLLSLMLEDLLRTQGADEVHVCREVAAGLKLARMWPLDCAVLETRLHGSCTYEVADELAARDVPFLFCTGFTVAELAPRHRCRPLLAKPYGDREFRTVLEQTLSR